MLIYILIALSFVGDGLITYLGRLVSSPADIWKPLLLLPGLFIGLFAVYTIVMIIMSRFVKDEGRIQEPVRWMTLEFIDTCLKVMGVRIHVSGMEKVPTDRRFLLVGNHRTIFEPVIGVLKFRDYKLSYISKKENLSMPIVHKLIESLGCLGLDRDNDRAAVKTILQAAKILKSGEMSMGIYPEGYTNRTDAPLLPFRNGAFKVAQRGGAPIVVTTIWGTTDIMKRMFRRRTHVYLDILRVIPYEDIDHVHTNEVGELVYDIMLKNLEKRAAEFKK